LPEIKLAEPVRKVLGEKEDEIRELTKNVENLNSKFKELEGSYNALKKQNEELSSALKKSKAEVTALNPALEESKQKNIKLQKSLMETKGQTKGVPLDELVLAYVMGAGGEISILQCSKALGVKEKQVKDAIDNLIKSKRLAP
jgi:septal ring factor EnvC (AmiA/AmiB activator)